MAGNGCGRVVNRKLDENLGCGVGKRCVALATGTWRGMDVEIL